MMIIDRVYIGPVEAWELYVEREDGSYWYQVSDTHTSEVIHNEFLGYDQRDAELLFKDICDEAEREEYSNDNFDEEDYYEPYDGLTENELRYNN